MLSAGIGGRNQPEYAPQSDYSKEYLIRKDIHALIQLSSVELDISIKELMQMSVEQIEKLSKKKSLKAKIDFYEKERSAINESRK